MKNFYSISDVVDLNRLIEKALFYKANPLVDKNLGLNKRLGLFFMNPSLRTRVSSQIAAENLGMRSFVINGSIESWAMEFDENAIMNGTKVEHVKDAVGVMSSYFDILALRTFASLKEITEDNSDFIFNQFVKYSKKPIVSLESALLHPLQSLADLITINEVLNRIQLNKKPKIVLTWAPHIKLIPHAVANSFSQWVNYWGESEFVITHPENYELDNAYTQNAKITTNQEEALEGADFVYVKNWSSYKKYGEVIPIKEDWMLNLEKLKVTNNAKIMHCLPVRRNVEISDEVIDSENSLVQQQAENRVWSAQAVLSEIIKSNG